MTCSCYRQQPPGPDTDRLHYWLALHDRDDTGLEDSPRWVGFIAAVVLAVVVTPFAAVGLLFLWLR